MKGSVTMPTDTIKECIYTALLLLMEQKGYDKITVTDITKKAGVSRMSFYRHFNSKDNILYKKAEECFFQMEERADFKEFLKSDEFIRFYFSKIKESRTILKSLDKAGKIDMLFPILLKYNSVIAEKYMEISSDLKENKYLLIYHTGGIFQIIKYWLQTDFKAPIDELIDVLKNIFREN